MELGEARTIRIDEAEAEGTRTGTINATRPAEPDSITSLPNAEQAPTAAQSGEIDQVMDGAKRTTDQGNDSEMGVRESQLASKDSIDDSIYFYHSEPSIIRFELLSKLNIARLQNELLNIQPLKYKEQEIKTAFEKEHEVKTALESGQLEDL